MVDPLKINLLPQLLSQSFDMYIESGILPYFLCFCVLVLFGDTHAVLSQGLLLALLSDIIPGDVWGIIQDVGDRNVCIEQVQCKCLNCCKPSPVSYHFNLKKLQGKEQGSGDRNQPYMFYNHIIISINCYEEYFTCIQSYMTFSVYNEKSHFIFLYKVLTLFIFSHLRRWTHLNSYSFLH